MLGKYKVLKNRYCYLQFTTNQVIMKAQTYLLTIIVLIFAACSGTKPTDIGIKNGQFKACPSSPNCISTQAADDDSQHKMSPMTYTGTMEAAKTKLLKIINDMERTVITEKAGNYIHSEFMSKTMKFVDDVEFYFDDANKAIHFRSASRKGHSDLGVNRKRMEAIVAAFNK